ncbi:MAG: hypothetical protein EOL97_13755, partial [Spirochaetia bacterium]|nr:hypothetical protein [Spirochaetia bacterium]
MIADYEYQEKLLLQFNAEEIDLLLSSIEKLQENQRKVGFKKSVITKEEFEVYEQIINTINEFRKD